MAVSHRTSVDNVHRNHRFLPVSWMYDLNKNFHQILSESLKCSYYALFKMANIVL